MAVDRVSLPSVRSAALNKLSQAVERHPAAFAGFAILAIALVSIALTMQGWRSRIPAFDDLTYFYDGRRFLLTGMMSRFGDVDSYGSYSAPGTTWLMLPGLLLFRDPRLVEYAGAALLHVITLTGLFILARRFFGLWCAGLVVLLYGLSATALFFAGSLWPIARPDFYVLTTLLACYWILKRDARYLAASLAVWGFGMYVDMAILPVFFIYPVLWFYYRPRLQIMPLFAAAVVILGVWSPYLRFEASRKFVDIRSQLLQQHVQSGDPRRTWCDPALTLQQWRGTSAAQVGPGQSESASEQAPAPSGFVVRFENIWKNLLSNFESVAPIPGASIGLFLLMLFGVVTLSVSGSAASQSSTLATPHIWRNPALRAALVLVLAGLLLAAVAFAYRLGWQGAPGTGRFLFISKLAKIMIWSGLALLVLPLLLVVLQHLLNRLGWGVQTPAQAEQDRMLAFSLIAPWFILLLFAEPGKPERFIWLWPIQLLFLAAVFTNVLPRLRVPRLWSFAGAVLLVLLVVGNSFLLDRLDSWSKTGWAGTDAPEVQAVDAISGVLQADGRRQASIGYQLYIYSFMADYNVSNPLYKVGAELDLLFQFQHGISNTDQCAEGLSAHDEFRIIETAPKLVEDAPSQYFLMDMGSEFSLLGEFGSFQVYKRTSPPGSG